MNTEGSYIRVQTQAAHRSLAKICTSVGLTQCIIRHGTLATDSIGVSDQAKTIEAIIGAIYIDTGFYHQLEYRVMETRLGLINDIDPQLEEDMLRKETENKEINRRRDMARNKREELMSTMSRLVEKLYPVVDEWKAIDAADTSEADRQIALQRHKAEPQLRAEQNWLSVRSRAGRLELLGQMKDQLEAMHWELTNLDSLATHLVDVIEQATKAHTKSHEKVMSRIIWNKRRGLAVTGEKVLARMNKQMAWLWQQSGYLAEAADEEIRNMEVSEEM